MWFGESWGASACNPRQRMTTPVGKECDRDLGGCGCPIVAGDQGVVLPCMDDDGTIPTTIAVHLDCWLRIVAGPCLAHEVMGCDGSGHGDGR